jgi:hypothetical protein
MSRLSHSPNRDLHFLSSDCLSGEPGHTNPDGLVAASVLQELKHGNIDVLLGIVFGDFAC